MLKRTLLALALAAAAACGFTIDPPKGWVKPPNSAAGLLLQYFEPFGGNAAFRSNMVATQGRLPCCKEGSTGLDSLIAKVTMQQARVLPMYKVMEKGGRKMGGRLGAFVIGSYAHGEDDLVCLQFFYLEGQDFTNIVYTCSLKDFPRLRPEFEKSLATFKAAPPASP